MTEKLLNQLNALRGLTCEQVGFAYFADIKGDGRNVKSVYSVTNASGGVIYSGLNAASARKRCEKIRAAIEQAAR